ncbi:hypothetical protein BC831DRAFT_457218, partial [Entophlyctis helioformis]
MVGGCRDWRQARCWREEHRQRRPSTRPCATCSVSCRTPTASALPVSGELRMRASLD